MRERDKEIRKSERSTRAQQQNESPRVRRVEPSKEKTNGAKATEQYEEWMLV